MTDGSVRTLWAESTADDLDPAALETMRDGLGMHLPGLAREEESIVGHRVLRENSGHATILRVRRKFDRTGFVLELTSSIEDEKVEDWEDTRSHVKDILATIARPRQPHADDQGPLRQLELQLLQQAQDDLMPVGGTPTSIEHVRLAALFEIESLGEQVAKEVGVIDEQIARLETQIKKQSDRSLRPRQSGRRIGPETIDGLTSSEFLTALPAVGSMALMATTGIAAATVLAAYTAPMVAYLGAAGATSLYAYAGVLVGKAVRALGPHRRWDRASQLLAAPLSGLALVISGVTFTFFRLASSYEAAMVFAILATAAFFAITALSATRFGGFGVPRRKRPLADGLEDCYELREELEVLRVRRKTALRTYSSRAQAASTIARHEDGTKDAWADPSWMRWVADEADG